MELLIYQFNNGSFSEAEAKQVLSICFDVAWPLLRKKFVFDGKSYFNERLNIEIERRKSFTESRKRNGLSPKKKGEAYALHMETTTETIIDNKNGSNGNLNIQHPTFEFISESLSGKIWQEQVCMKMKWDPTLFSEFVIRWLSKKELAGTYEYPVNAMKDFVIKDYEKECMNKKSKSAIPHYLNGM